MTRYGIEAERLSFLEQRGGVPDALDFAKRAYMVYRTNLLLKRKVLNARGMQDKKESYVTHREYRRMFIESCLAFRLYITDHI
jgi:hypothetical protein